GEEIEHGGHGREHREHREPHQLEARAEEPEERGREVEGARPGDVGHVAVHDLAGGQADAGGEDVPLVAAADGAEDERGMQHGGAEGEATGDRPVAGARAGLHGSEALAAGPAGRNDCAGTGGELSASLRAWPPSVYPGCGTTTSMKSASGSCSPANVRSVASTSAGQPS